MRYLFIFFLVLTIVSCKKEEIGFPLLPPPSLMEVPKGFPAIPEPEGNEFTRPRWELGKKLFFDPVMSVDSSVSCATCHKPALAFSDDLAFSPGVKERPGVRNAPTLANVAYHPYFTREGGVPTLEMQVFVPIQEHNEFDFNIVLLAERLAKGSTYVEMANAAYDRTPDPFVITRSLACFERSLLSGMSPFDLYSEHGQQDALTAAALRGRDLFFGQKANCSQCHGGFNFTNYAFENNGLYETYPDIGRMRLTGEEADLALFKVPTLRNIELTAPYMHDGSFETLAAVIEHYDNGGKDHPQKSQLIKPLGLTETEKEDLLAFLESLTDEVFINNPLFKN